MSDGGENVRRMQEYLHPHSEHLIDWFHNTMRLTVLQQQTKALQEERPPIGGKVSKQLESIKNLLWHGNVEEALERVANLTIDLALIRAHSSAAESAVAIAEFDTYIRNNQEFIPNFGERRRKGETISTAFVESTINQVVSRRSRSSRCCGHFEVPTCCYRRERGPQQRTGEAFRRWYPRFRPKRVTRDLLTVSYVTIHQ